MSFKKIFLIFLLIIAFFVSQVPRLFDQKTRLVFCNVGEGDGAVLITPQHVFLIDAGRSSKMRDCLARYLPFFRREITGAVITHPDADHVNGLKSVIQSYSVKYLFSNFSAKQNSDYSEIIDILRNRGVRFKSFTSGEKISVGEGLTTLPMGQDVSPVPTRNVTIDSLWPLNEHSEAAGDTNLFSTVSVVTIGQSRFLMLADAEIATQISLLPQIVSSKLVETRYCASNGQKQSVVGIVNASTNTNTVRETHSSASLQNKNDNRYLAVKLSHHGSAKNFSYTLIRETKPRYAVISVGANKYGHPGKKAIELLNSVGDDLPVVPQNGQAGRPVPTENKIEILRTDQMGDVIFECEKECKLVRSK